MSQSVLWENLNQTQSSLVVEENFLPGPYKDEEEFKRSTHLFSLFNYNNISKVFHLLEHLQQLQTIPSFGHLQEQHFIILDIRSNNSFEFN